jgi:hypothetical protein
LVWRFGVEITTAAAPQARVPLPAKQVVVAVRMNSRGRGARRRDLSHNSFRALDSGTVEVDTSVGDRASHVEDSGRRKDARL